MNIVRIDKTKSTNDYVLKYLKTKRDTIVIAKRQTAGRGTKGRSFSSDQGGIYLSMLKFYGNLPAVESFSIIRDVSVAVVKTLLAFNIKAKIKWPNDIVVEGKKICGILTENKIEGNNVVYSVVGLGLNVNNLLPGELSDIAVTMKDLVGEVNFEAVLMTLLFNLSGKSKVEEYVGYSCVLNREVTVFEGENVYLDTPVEILNDGRIKMQSGKVLASAEIKLKM